MREKRDSITGNMRGGPRDGNPYRGDIPRGAAAVRDGVSADWVRLRLLSETVRERSVCNEHRGMESAEELTRTVAASVRDEEAAFRRFIKKHGHSGRFRTHSRLFTKRHKDSGRLIE